MRLTKLVPRATPGSRAQAMRHFRAQLRIGVWWLLALAVVMAILGFSDGWSARLIVASAASASLAILVFLITRSSWRIERTGEVSRWGELLAAVGLLALGLGSVAVAVFDYEGVRDARGWPLAIVLIPFVLVVALVGVARGLRRIRGSD